MPSAEELKEKERYGVEDLLDILALLRSEQGCPWDREQTHRSIRQNFIEETYEVVEAIDREDLPLLREELGDVLLQVVFHARIAEEAGEFTFSDVADEICRKLIIRHPHVFGTVQVDGTSDVLVNWDRIKAETKHQKSVGDTLDAVARSLPSLMRAAKLAKKSAKAGFGRPLEERLGDMLYDLSALCAENGIDPEKALYDACERRISEVKEKEASENGAAE